jgi:hypothetical protein
LSQHAAQAQENEDRQCQEDDGVNIEHVAFASKAVDDAGTRRRRAGLPAKFRILPSLI